MEQRVLRLNTTHLETIRDHILRCLPEEACGLLGGREGYVEVVVPITNQLHSPVRFRMQPEELLATLQYLESNGLDLLAIFHSHPHGPEVPSDTDLREYAYPKSLMMIWFPKGSDWQCRAFQVDVEKREYQEIPILVGEDAQP